MENKFKSVVQGKPAASSRKYQDSSQRHGHRREANPPKSSPATQNNKPGNRPRGNNGYRKNNTGSGYPRPNSVFEDSVGSVVLDNFDNDNLLAACGSARKKQNLNFLFNFNVTPRERNRQDSGGHKGHAHGNTNNGNGKMNRAARAEYDKYKYLHANSELLVKPSYNYTATLGDVDKLMDWDKIEQVNVSVFEEINCPICLYPPLASKITRCGHVYCWPCILKYLSFSHKTWRQCPICNDPIAIEELKSVTKQQMRFINNDDVLQFCLKRRERNSLISTQVQVESEVDEDEGAGAILPLVKTLNCKLQIATREMMFAIINREQSELEEELKNMTPTEEEAQYVKQAIQLLNERKEKFLMESASNASVFEYLQNKTDDEDKINGEKSYLYFYQASDGQQIYLHPINCKILEMMHGDFSMCPPIIEGRVLQKESYSVNELFRKRYKHLQHLPLSCEVDFVEIEFLHFNVPKEIMEIFGGDLKQRAIKRSRKQRFEQQQSKKISEKVRQYYGYPSEATNADINIDSTDQFPTCAGGADTEQPIAAKDKKAGRPSFARIITTSESGGELDLVDFPLPGTSGGAWGAASAPKDVPDLSGLNLRDDNSKRITIDLSELSGAAAAAVGSNGNQSKSGAGKKNKKGKGKGVKLFSTGLMIKSDHTN